MRNDSTSLVKKKRKEKIMKNFKKMMALIIAAVMVIGTMGTMTAFADPDAPAYDQSITIDGLDEGDEVNFYQILKWVGSEDKEENLNVANVDGWDVCEPFESVIKNENMLKDIVDGKITSELAGQLSRLAEDPQFTETVAKGATSVKVDIANDGQLGLYMAIIDPADKATVYNPVFASADYHTDGETNSFNVPLSSASYYDEAAAKKSKLDLVKTAANTADYNGDNGDTAAAGDVLTFTVKTTIPGYGETFMSPAFVLKDEMTNLELIPGSITVTAEGLDEQGKFVNDEEEEVVGYVLGDKVAAEDSEPNKEGYSVSFTPEYLKTLTVPTEVTIVYQAKVLKEDDPANVDKENNTVTLEYSHDPSTESQGNPGGDKEYQKDITNHYTFSIDADNLWKGSGKVGESGSEIIKIAVDRDGNPIMSEIKTSSFITPEEYEASPLAGCSFELYTVKNGQKDKKVGSADSDAAGRIKFEGLDEGEYILIETKAPAGYVKDTEEHHIVITANTTTKSYTEYYDQDGGWHDAPGDGLTAYTYEAEELVSYSIIFDDANVATHTFVHESKDAKIKWSEASSNEAPASIHNTKGVELPSTGGMGTRLFYIIGAILVVGAGVLLVTRRRMNAN